MGDWCDRRDSRLAKQTDEKVVAGVCAGLARHVGLDPSLVRLGTVLAAAMTGFFPIVPVYLVLACVLPDAGLRRRERAADAGVATSERDGPTFCVPWGDDDELLRSLDDDRTTRTGRRSASVGGRAMSPSALGWVLIGVGAFALVDQLDWIDWRIPAALGMVAVGINLLARGRSSD